MWIFQTDRHGFETVLFENQCLARICTSGKCGVLIMLFTAFQQESGAPRLV
jgi:hypothetical protein